MAEETTEEVETTTENDATDIKSLAIATVADAPTCDATYEDVMIYVEDVKKFHHCAAGEWKAIDQEHPQAPTTKAIAAIADAPACAEGNAGSMLYVKDVKQFHHCDAGEWKAIESAPSAALSAVYKGKSAQGADYCDRADEVCYMRGLTVWEKENGDVVVEFDFNGWRYSAETYEGITDRFSRNRTFNSNGALWAQGATTNFLVDDNIMKNSDAGVIFVSFDPATYVASVIWDPLDAENSATPSTKLEEITLTKL